MDFWAEWCGSCRMVSPIVEELSKEYENQIHFVKVNVDNNRDLAMKYNVLSIPTLLLLKNDQIEGQKVGANSKNTIKEWIDKTLN